MGEHLGWAVETSRDGRKWRRFGTGWTFPNEPLLLHAVPAFVRYRLADGEDEWCEPLERDGDQPMTLLRLESHEREDLWPGEEHVGLPLLLSGGEVGRLLRFEHSGDGSEWTYALEFRGERRA